MLKIGLTGGIGSGKSIIGTIFSQLGVPVFSSDTEAKILMNVDSNLIQQIKYLIGEDIIDENGLLNRKKIAEKVFIDKFLLHELNAIVHPAVRKHFKKWVQKYSHLPYILNESALIFEHNLYKELDAVIVVLAPEDIRIKRVMQRDKLEEKQVVERMKNQMTEEERKQKGAYFILNDDVHPVIPQVLKIHSILSTK